MASNDFQNLKIKHIHKHTEAQKPKDVDPKMKKITINIQND